MKLVSARTRSGSDFQRSVAFALNGECDEEVGLDVWSIVGGKRTIKPLRLACIVRVIRGKTNDSPNSAARDLSVLCRLCRGAHGDHVVFAYM